MEPASPTRRFKPEPIETTVKKSRKFAPEPVETSTRSSRKFAPEPIETTTKSTRKFAPEPVETTTRTTRKFAPEPIEVTTSSNRQKKPETGSLKPRSRFAPQPVETTTRSSRQKIDDHWRRQSVEFKEEHSHKQPPASKPGTKPRRRFAPQLLETARRSRKAGDELPAVLPSDKTEAVPGTLNQGQVARPKPIPIAPENTPANSTNHVPQITAQMREMRRIGSPLALRQDSRASSRSHSFRVPDLDPIESSESDEDTPPSPSTSPPSSLEGRDHMYKHATRIRESVDDRFSGYLLRLAARQAEKQLRDQAIAAYANNEFPEHVDHFIDHDNEKALASRHNSSFTKVNWELREMHKHHEKLQKQRETGYSMASDTSVLSGLSTQTPLKGPWGNPIFAFLAENDLSGNNHDILESWQREIDMKEMRERARPPMLGKDIEFPRCASPEPARFDVTQGSHHLRQQMCYLSQQVTPPENECEEGLWRNTSPANTSNNVPRPSLWSTASRPSSQNTGLWGGFCTAADAKPTVVPSGLLTPSPRTPMTEIENPMEQQMMRHLQQRQTGLLTPMDSLDETLERAQTIDDEFDDSFVTQVYNYLSLGYPAIARDFDEELSKISHIPIEELREDDYLKSRKGYIRLGEDCGITEDICMRWQALRLYIKEWAKQQPGMGPVTSPSEGWGVSVRRGSWAW